MALLAEMIYVISPIYELLPSFNQLLGMLELEGAEGSLIEKVTVRYDAVRELLAWARQGWPGGVDEATRVQHLLQGLTRLRAEFQAIEQMVADLDLIPGLPEEALIGAAHLLRYVRESTPELMSLIDAAQGS